MTRDELILSALPAVDICTKPYRRKYWYEDLRSSVILRIIQAVDRYDPSKAKFSTFIGYHIRGSILDFKRAWARQNRPEWEGPWRSERQQRLMVISEWLTETLFIRRASANRICAKRALKQRPDRYKATSRRVLTPRTAAWRKAISLGVTRNWEQRRAA